MAEVIAPPPDVETSHDKVDTSQNKDAAFPELFTGDSLLELCNSFWERSPGSGVDVQPYLRGCKWSPDGTCCLSVVNYDGFHIMELPRDLYEGCPSRDRMITLLPAIIHVKESGLVYDFCWYPKMNSYIPETCSWITTKKNSPIQMWDAYNGSLRCSYRGFNAVDEMEPALSITFTHEGNRIVAGYKKCLRTFDVERPGRDFLEHKVKSPVSSLASNEDYLAVGSWDRNIRLFSISNMGTYKSIGYMQWHRGGVTHIKFTPDKTKLVSGARKDNDLLVWDLRYFKKPLNILKRCVSTNQRIYFDISACGRYLVSGGTDGVIRVWDEKYTKWTERCGIRDFDEESATFRFRLHQDCCNSVSIHPSRPILATGSGQFHFVDPVKVLDEEIDSSDDDTEQVAQIGPQMTLSSSNDQSQNTNEVCEMKLIGAGQVDEHSSDTGNQASNEMHKFGDQDQIQVIQSSIHEEIPTKIHKMDSTNEVSILTPEHDIAEEPPPKKAALDTGGKSPTALPKMETGEEVPTYKCALEIDLNHTNGVKTNTATTASTSKHGLEIIYKTPDEMDVDEEPPNNKAKLEMFIEIPTEEPKTHSLDRLKEETKVHTKADPVGGEHVLDINDTPSSQAPNEQIDIKSKPPKLIKSDHVTRTNEVRLKFPINIKSKVTADRKSDDDSKDSTKEMKYSSFAENNLTFWWIAQVSEV